MNNEEVFITTDHIFADLDLDDSDELIARSELLSEVSRLIKNSGLTQKEISKKLHISQPKVSMLISGKLSAFSTDTLMHYLTLLGCNVEIRIRAQSSRNRITKGKLLVHKKPTPKKRIRPRAKKLMKK